MDKFIADAVYLWTQSSVHCSIRIDHFYRLTVPAFKAGRARIIYRDSSPRCLYSCMLMESAGEDGYMGGTRKLQPEDWFSNRGSLWVVDFIAPFGDAYSIAREMYKELADEFSDHDIAYFRRGAKGGHRRSFKRLKHA